ncbi:hypothetical protein C8J36_11037 [Rhizobium sp. PP-F2F-G48]|uniref:hypothetical protein n=1 Tax=Rhizobium sp. PP-F2F-G48 TaxID=2135651 RepID=UPI00104E9954|nr:hypothetical protein [Rhizobium sp. PP-F2F-G48]TCM51030.1 hypothetical protein C8J36_11037 [Rhizobium sp. PP-F2F-G48]
MEPETWRYEYERTRYLREVHDVVLKRRFDDLAANLWSTDAAGNVTPPRSSESRQGLLRLLLHTELEQMGRGGEDARDFSEQALRDASAAGYVPPRLKSPFTGSPACYAKFGKRDHIRAAYERGALRIMPASSYDDPSLNSAQADKELEHATVTPNEHLMFKLYGLNAEGKEVEVPVQKKELFRYMMVPDFYVWCCGLSYDARLFHEFEAEAVLVVRDQEAFSSRVRDAVKAKVPSGEVIDGPLSYYDPYTIRRDQLIPIFSKNLRYLYQNEYRFAWTMPAGSALEPFFIEIGPMSDIAEFYETV